MAFAAVTGKLPRVAWVPVHRSSHLGSDLRHHLRDDRPRGRPEDRCEIERDPVRQTWTSWLIFVMQAMMNFRPGASRAEHCISASGYYAGLTARRSALSLYQQLVDPGSQPRWLSAGVLETISTWAW